MSKTVILETSKGNITIELNEEKAPATVANFMKYVNDEFYNGTIFHRVIPNFMIQGGGFMPGMVQKMTENPVDNEANNGLSNVRGSIAMARTNDPHSATAQFFINLKDNDFLNHTAPTGQGWGYCVFGMVTNGIDVVDAIAGVATANEGGHGDVPTEAITINKVSEA
ncbi:MAG: peptidylprolyl isomerase [Gammaproteobacteria bacterium]|nr:peptidylprolyl isomerase [Gammaproteobacteria bacterium]